MLGERVLTVGRDYDDPEYQYEHHYHYRRVQKLERHAFPMARIDYNAMELLSVVDRGFLRVRGQRTAYVGVGSLEGYDENKGLIRIGKYARTKAMVDIGDKVSVSKVIPKVANEVTVRMGFEEGKIIRHPFGNSYIFATKGEDAKMFYPQSLPNTFDEYLISIGDRIYPSTSFWFGVENTGLWLDVEGIKPKHEVVQINNKTKFKVLLPRKK